MTFITDYKAFYQGELIPVSELIWDDGILAWVKLGEAKIVPVADVTLCANTKQYDINDLAIYTHDVVKVKHENAQYTGVITFLDKYGSFAIKKGEKYEAFGLGQEIEVMGSELTNPDLLKEKLF